MIRRAALTDGPRIRTLHRASIVGLCGRAYSGEQIAAWVAALPSQYEPIIERGVVFVDDDAGVLRGFGICTPEKELVNATYVSPTATGLGIGRLLMTEMETLLRDCGASEFRLNATLNATGFYEVLGYTNRGEGLNQLPTGVELPCVVMVKSAR
jgi:GNAT superfamily N-acetyltransferase